MATHIEAQIIEALLEHFKLLALPSNISGVAYPGVDFKPTKKAFIRLQLFKNDPVQNQIGFGRDPIRQGILQASVFWPVGQGVIQASEVAGQIRDHFSRGTKIDSADCVIRIDEEAIIGSDIQEPNWLQVPVSIPYIIYP